MSDGSSTASEDETGDLEMSYSLDDFEENEEIDSKPVRVHSVRPFMYEPEATSQSSGDSDNESDHSSLEDNSRLGNTDW